MSNLARVDSLRSVIFSDITAMYTELGISLGHPMRLLHFVNNTNALIYISFDGINDNLVLPPLTFLLWDLTTNKDIDESFRYQKGTQLQLKYVGSAAISGSVYAMALYGKGE